jgi:trehalose synthase
VHVVWRCHIGSDHRNEWTEEAWHFLRPYIDAADAVVFSRAAYVPPEVPETKVSVIPPSIDPFSPKNQDLSSDGRQRILRRIGVFASQRDEPAATFTRRDGTRARWFMPHRWFRRGNPSIRRCRSSSRSPGGTG